MKTAPAAAFLCFAVLYFAGTRERAVSWGEESRLATIESLVERGTFRIDDSALGNSTRDKVLIGDHFVSDKPPLLQVLAAPAYALLHAFGLALAPDACRAGACAYRPLTFLVVGLPAALLLAVFAFVARRATGSPWQAGALTAALGLATMLWPYSLVFNNHVPAAAALLAAFLLVPPAPLPGGPLRLFAAGACVGLAAGFDLLTLLPSAALAIVVLWRARGRALFFVLGALCTGALTIGCDLAIWGSPLPPYFAVHGYRYPGSPFHARLAGIEAPKDALENLSTSLIGEQGLLSHCPLLAWPILALLAIARDPRHPWRAHAVAAGLGALAVAAYVGLRTALGGQAYANRYLLPVVPLLFLFAALAGRKPSRWGTAALALAALLSVTSAARATLQPWRAIPPPFYLSVAPKSHALSLCDGLRERCWP